jgi:ferredoxin
MSAAPAPASALATRWLTREALDGVLDELARGADLIAPVRAGEEVLFQRVAGAASICRDYVNTLVPPKQFLLPTPEPLLEYRLDRDTPLLSGEPGPEAGPETVLFGVRSCDAAGLAYLERFLSGGMFGSAGVADPHFMRRRERTTVLSVVCQKPGDTCMCVCCEGGPALARGFDWQLTELVDGWLVEIGSPRGERLARRLNGALAEPPPGAGDEKLSRVRDVVEHFRDSSVRRVQTMAGSRMVSTGRLSEAFWMDVGERCFECGGCAFVCPTCYCFNVVDQPAPGAGEFPPGDGGPGESAEAEPGPEGTWTRLRFRDNCMLAGFVRQAGGSYPRWTCGERCQTRFFHKLSWQFHRRMGALGCTGCGRCVTTCMGGIGIDRVSDQMTRALIHSPPPSADSGAGPPSGRD